MKKLFGATMLLLVVLVAVAASFFVYWNLTHYSVAIGKVAVVTDQFGGILRVQKGPLA
jgi:DNA-binding transcriptional regulator of glucitol operon